MVPTWRSGERPAVSQTDLLISRRGLRRTPEPVRAETWREAVENPMGKPANHRWLTWDYDPRPVMEVRPFLDVGTGAAEFECVRKEDGRMEVALPQEAGRAGVQLYDAMGNFSDELEVKVPDVGME